MIAMYSTAYQNDKQQKICGNIEISIKNEKKFEIQMRVWAGAGHKLSPGLTVPLSRTSDNLSERYGEYYFVVPQTDHPEQAPLDPAHVPHFRYLSLLPRRSRNQRYPGGEGSPGLPVDTPFTEQTPWCFLFFSSVSM